MTHDPRVSDPCPVCGEDNRCEIARGSSHCWCFEVEVAPEARSPVGEGLDTSCLCPKCLGELVTSPCIRICELDPASGLCRGCLRTIEEIQDWPSSSNREKLEILRVIRVRKQELAKPDPSPAEEAPRRPGGDS